VTCHCADFQTLQDAISVEAKGGTRPGTLYCITYQNPQDCIKSPKVDDLISIVDPVPDADLN
jgi:hypothetical protein